MSEFEPKVGSEFKLSGLNEKSASEDVKNTIRERAYVSFHWRRAYQYRMLSMLNYALSIFFFAPVFLASVLSFFPISFEISQFSFYALIVVAALGIILLFISRWYQALAESSDLNTELFDRITKSDIDPSTKNELFAFAVKRTLASSLPDHTAATKRQTGSSQTGLSSQVLNAGSWALYHLKAGDNVFATSYIQPDTERDLQDFLEQRNVKVNLLKLRNTEG